MPETQASDWLVPAPSVQVDGGLSNMTDQSAIRKFLFSKAMPNGDVFYYEEEFLMDMLTIRLFVNTFYLLSLVLK